jgi:hypothetical protein
MYSNFNGINQNNNLLNQNKAGNQFLTNHTRFKQIPVNPQQLQSFKNQMVQN